MRKEGRAEIYLEWAEVLHDEGKKEQAAELILAGWSKVMRATLAES